MHHWKSWPAAQQPDWESWLTARMRESLAAAPGLVDGESVQDLRVALAVVARGTRQVIQAGDCAEDPAECVPGVLERKATLLDALADVQEFGSGLPTVRVGRLAGQFA